MEDLNKVDPSQFLPNSTELTISLHETIGKLRQTFDSMPIPTSKKELAREVKILRDIIIHLVEAPVENTRENLNDYQRSLVADAIQAKLEYAFLNIQLIAEQQIPQSGLNSEQMASNLVNINEALAILQEKVKVKKQLENPTQGDEDVGE